MSPTKNDIEIEKFALHLLDSLHILDQDFVTTGLRNLDTV